MVSVLNILQALTEDLKACCNWSKAIRRAHRGVITKLTKEIDELSSATTILKDMPA